MRFPLSCLSWFASLALVACGEATSTATESPAANAAPSASAPARPFVDAPLASAQQAMLEAVWRATSRLPDVPHQKNRSRIQALLVVGCIEAGLPVRARTWSADITGWERGQCLAELADHCVQNRLDVDVDALLATALQIADDAMRGDDAQAWRRDRIRAKVAAVRLAQGHHEVAGALTKDLVDAEVANLAAVRAAQLDAKDLERQLADLQQMLASENVDRAQPALQLCVHLLARFAADEAARECLLDLMQNAYPKLPLTMRIDVLLAAADAATAAGQREVARLLASRCNTLVLGKGWLPEDQVALRARVATSLARAGDQQAARAGLDDAMTQFDATRERIVDVFRGEALRPIAIGYAVLGDAERAASAFRLALTEGMANPNGRPRLEDLAKTTLAMLASDFVPPADLVQRVEAIASELTAPW